MAGRSKEERRLAALKGWETRRRNNPLKWGKRLIAKKQAVSNEIREAAQLQELIKKSFENDIELMKAQRHLDALKADKAKLEYFGTVKPERWRVNLLKAMQQFIEDRDANEDSATIKKSYNKWLRLKISAKKRLDFDDGSKEFHNLIALFGSNLHLPMDGKFSIQRFVDSP